MNPLLISAILFSFLFASFMKGMTGLGFSTLCLGILTCFIDIKLAIPLIMLPSLSSNALVIWNSGRIKEALVRFWPLYFFAVCGLLAGLWLLGSVKSQTARTVLGVVMVIYGFWALRKGDILVPPSLRRKLFLPVGLFTGFVNGLTGSQVMPILPYLLGLQIDKNLLVAVINTSFTISSLFMLAGLTHMGLITRQALLLAIVGIPLVLTGITWGTRIRKRASEETFRKMVLFLLIGIGMNLVVRA